MDGVTILAQEAIMSFNKPLTIAITLIIAVICIMVHISLIIFDFIQSDKINIFVACVVCCVCFACALCCSKLTEYPTNQYEYFVIVDDTVLMSEFCDKYEIIDQNGSIFTVKSRGTIND